LTNHRAKQVSTSPQYKVEREIYIQLHNVGLIRPGKIVDLDKIFRELHKIPPLQLKERARHYFGIQVKGFGKLSSVEELKEDLIGITLRPEGTVGFIRTAFSPDEYPGIGVVEHNAKIEIQGKITDIENCYGIYLSEAKLKFGKVLIFISLI
jgi:hypothetical protein